MSYCRANGEDSDVYVIGTGDGWECCGCFRMPKARVSCDDGVYEVKGSYNSTTRKGILAHLEEHRRLGDKVPERAFKRLRREIAAG